MMIQQSFMPTHKMRTREVRGNLPALVAIKAKPTQKHPPDQWIRREWEKDARLADGKRLVEQQKKIDLMSEWEQATDRKIQGNIIRSRVNHMMKVWDEVQEERRIAKQQ